MRQIAAARAAAHHRMYMLSLHLPTSVRQWRITIAWQLVCAARKLTSDATVLGMQPATKDQGVLDAISCYFGRLRDAEQATR